MSDEKDKVVAIAEWKRSKNRERNKRKRQRTKGKLKSLKLADSLAPVGVNETGPQAKNSGLTLSNRIPLLAFRLLGYAIYMTGFLMTVRNAWSQGNQSVDQWLAVARDCLPELGMAFMLEVCSLHYKRGNRLKAGISAIVFIGLLYVTLQNFDQYSTSAMSNTNIERIEKRQKELEDQYDVSSKRMRYDNAVIMESKAISDKDKQCAKNDGSMCQTYLKRIVPEAIQVKVKAWEEYQSAKRQAKEQAERELSGLTDKNTSAVSYRKFLPLLGAVFILIGSV